jgi:predicted regulator of Ras-like GTPase activity (Roadblock/LC7/MglB family)
MFGFIKNLFKSGGEAPQTQAPTPKPNDPVAPTPAPAAAPAKNPTASPPPAAPPAPKPVGLDPADTVELPVRTLVARLPEAVRDKVTKSSGKANYKVQKSRVMAQMPSGAVKFTYAELRSFNGELFPAVAEETTVTVEVPLADLIAKLGASAFPLRPGQKRVEVPADVTGLFGTTGAPVNAPHTTVIGVAPVETPNREAISTPAPEPAPAPTPAPVVPAPKPAAPPAAAPAPTPEPEPEVRAPLAISQEMREMMSASASAAKPVAPKPAAPEPAPVPKLSLAPTPAAPAASAVAAPAGLIAVTLAQVSENWPEAVRQEIARDGLAGATLWLPGDDVGKGLKFGKVAFTWRQLRATVQPAEPTNPTAMGDTSVELPLKVIAPLYMKNYKPAQPQKKLAVDEQIPDMFAAGRAAAPAPVAAPTPAAAPPPSPAAPAPVTTSALGQLFGQPAKAVWTPGEITQKLTALPGVAGALIALQDGLLVAAHLPAPLKGETCAAMLAQMFGRVSQCGGELNLGEVTTLQFVAKQAPWQVSKIGTLLLAVQGRASEALPEAQLKVVVEELARQNKK